jgi:D-hydroxyproline dehydrogenase subunit beta
MKYDLIIVGAGILGTAHAYHAAQKGLKVLILEKDNFSIGSTVRNFGQIVPSGMVGKWFDFGVKSTEVYQSIQQKFDITVRKNGSTYIASDPDEWLLVNKLFDHHKITGYDCSLLSKRQCLEIYPELKEDYVVGAIHFPNEISVEPNQLIYRLLSYLKEQKGVAYYPNTAVLACKQNSNEVLLRTATNQTFAADKIVICCGYTFTILYPEIFNRSGLIVSKLQMLQTVPMTNINFAGNILTGLTIRRYEAFEAMPSYKNITTPENLQELKKWGIHILFKQAIDGSIIIGDSHEYAPVGKTDELGFDTKELIDDLILKEAKRIVHFPVNKIARKWAGFYAQHPDDIFQFDISSNIHICTGIGGKGMTTSLGFAEDSLRKLLF